MNSRKSWGVGSQLQRAITKHQSNSEGAILSIQEKIQLHCWKITAGTDLKFNPLLPTAPSATKVVEQVETAVKYRLSNGFLIPEYAKLVKDVGTPSPIVKFRCAAQVLETEYTVTKKMLLKFTEDHAHEGGHGHDDHGHGHDSHGSENKPEEVSTEKLSEIYDMILQSLRGQFLFLYESGVLNFYVYAIIEEALEPALDAAHGELQDLTVLKTSGDPILQNLYKEDRRQVEMSIAVF